MTDEQNPVSNFPTGLGKRRVWPWCVGLGILLALLFLLTCGIIWDDGKKVMPFQFLVLDARTQQPVPDVKIVLMDDATDARQVIKTGADGRASIVLPCTITCRTRVVMFAAVSRRSIYYPARLLTVSKTGFEKRFVPLNNLVGWGHAGDYSPPPLARIELSPQ